MGNTVSSHVANADVFMFTFILPLGNRSEDDWKAQARLLSMVQIKLIHDQTCLGAGLMVIVIAGNLINSRTLLPVPADPFASKSAYRDSIPLSDSSPHMCALTSNVNLRKPSCCSSAM
jgi:hypothetical protein